MKLPLLLAALLTTLVYSEILLGEVPIKLGPKSFKDGDVIKIENVKASSPKLEIGDIIEVSGKYHLSSEEKASLSLFLTQIEGNGKSFPEKSQTVKTKEGWNDFKATITKKFKGHLHLTFYNNETGKPFGGVYFGTEEQMKNAKPAWVKHYLAGTVKH